MLLALGLHGAVMGGAELEEKTRRLESLRAEIKSLQTRLEAKQAKKSRAEARLRETERRLGELRRRLRSIDSDIQSSRAQLSALQVQRDEQEALMAGQRRGLAAEARAAYMMGRQQQAKLLLNQEQPAAIGRILVYFTYLSRARSEQIAAMRNSLQGLRDLERSIGEQARTLEALRARHEEETAGLKAQQRAREQAVAALSHELSAQGGQLGRLRKDEQQLEKLVASLERVLADIPVVATGHEPFRSLKGKLRWPADGELTQRFGSRRGSSGLKWQGVVIAAPEGGGVRAVSQGRVAFADWMRGFGLLLIIDHGDGYMSLYGHNQALYKDVGEWVDTGEVVAALGASGGQTQAGLYFELRHQGRPVDPLAWCAGKPARGSS